MGSNNNNRPGGSFVKKGPCFWCQGPHQVKDCPDKRRLNALSLRLAELSTGDMGSTQNVQSQPDDSEGEENPEDVLGAFPQWCNAVSLETQPVNKGKNVVAHDNPSTTPTGPKRDKGESEKRMGKGLMYVDVKLNGKPVRAMVDTGATHNYLASTEVERLGLILEKGAGRVKAINSPAQPIAGVAKGVSIKVGPHETKTNFSVVKMDDFKVILGLEFLRETKAGVLPATNSLMMLGNKPCMVPLVTPNTGGKFLSAFQLKKGVHGSQVSISKFSSWPSVTVRLTTDL